MDIETPLGPQEYICPLCGERVALGTHFCGVGEPGKILPFAGAANPRRKRRDFSTLKFVTNAIVGILLSVALLWGLVGAISLAAVPVGLLIGLIALRKRRREDSR